MKPHLPAALRKTLILSCLLSVAAAHSADPVFPADYTAVIDATASVYSDNRASIDILAAGDTQLALWAANGNTVDITSTTGDINLYGEIAAKIAHTDGAAEMGIAYADGAGTSVTLTAVQPGSKISIANPSGTGFLTTNGGSITLNGQVESNLGSGIGAFAKGGDININGAFTQHAGAEGFISAAGGSLATNGAVNITATYHAAYANQAGSKVHLAGSGYTHQLGGIIRGKDGGIVEIDGSTIVTQSAANTTDLITANTGSLVKLSGTTNNITANKKAITSTDGGTIDISGSANISVLDSGTSTWGLNANKTSVIRIGGSLATSGSNLGLVTANSSTVTIAQNADISGNVAIAIGTGAAVTIKGAGIVTALTGTAVDVAGHGADGTASQITLEGTAAITGINGGVRAYQGGHFIARQHAAFHASSATEGYAVYSGSSLDGNRAYVELNGATITSASAHAIIAGTGEINAKNARYTISGNIMASSDGLISLSMADGSFLNGRTLFKTAAMQDSYGTINLEIQGNSLWQVAGNSQLTNLTLGQGSALQLAFTGSSLTDIITAAGTITLESGSYIHLTGDLATLKDNNAFDFFNGTLVNNGVKFVGFDGTDWVEYQYTQTGANTFQFTGATQTLPEAPGFIPEPATAALGLLGLVSLLARRRKV